MAKDYDEVINQTATATAKETVIQFKKQGLLKDNKHSAFQKTETILYNYNNFKEAINDKYEHIKNIKCSGVDKKSKSITSFSSGGYFESKSEEEKSDEKIIQLEQSIAVTNNLITVIDSALTKLKNDKYYDIIRYKYFEKKTNEEIAEYYDVDGTTISRNKSRLINIIKIYLFSDDVVKELFS